MKVSRRNAALYEAERALKKRKGPASDADRPYVPIPGPRAKVLPGQLDIYGHEHDGWRK